MNESIHIISALYRLAKPTKPLRGDRDDDTTWVLVTRLYLSLIIELNRRIRAHVRPNDAILALRMSHVVVFKPTVLVTQEGLI